MLPFTFMDGSTMPAVGIGTFKLRNTPVTSEAVLKTLEVALDAGYRLIDTASIYRNEADIGSALTTLYEKYSISRNDLFITSKLAPQDHGYSSALQSCSRSIEDLKCQYLDLFLIHWPAAAKLKPDDPLHRRFRQESWRALEDLKDKGLVKHIGVSNYGIEHLAEMKEYARYPAEVNQVEFHPHLYQKELLDYCAANDIMLQAYSSLGTGELVKEDAVLRISSKIGRTPAQILLKWALQHNVGVLPKSTDPIHIRENLAMDFTLSNEDMGLLNSLHCSKHFCWDPSRVS